MKEYQCHPHQGRNNDGLITSEGLIGIFTESHICVIGPFQPSTHALEMCVSFSTAVTCTGTSNLMSSLEYARQSRAPGAGCCVCIVALQDRLITGISTGDVQLCIVREGSIIRLTDRTMRDWRTPHILGPRSEEEGTLSQIIEEPVQHGDVVIIGTVGLWDNVGSEAVPRVIDRARESYENRYHSDYERILGDVMKSFFAREICHSLLDLAMQGMTDEHWMSPYALRARQNGMFTFRGGRNSAISVLVAVVGERSGLFSNSAQYENALGP